MDVIERLGNNAVVPVVVMEDENNAVSTAKALFDGGIDVMEVTLRTAAGIETIKRVAAEAPYMMVGAGTVVNLNDCKKAVEAGAKFIVCPGFDIEVVEWCVNNGVTVTPGCVTPSEIMGAMKFGIKVLKFFPANVYGGLTAMKSLSGPFGGIKFIPTGGVNAQNIGEYAAAPYVFTVGGSWVCSKKDISEGNFEKITRLSREAVKNSLGFELAHVGVNTADEAEALKVAEQFDTAFGFGIKNGGSSVFAGTGVEIMKSMFLGKNGHIAVKTNSVRRAVGFMEKSGIVVDNSTIKYNGDKEVAVYLQNEIGGFAVHLLQK